jgi:hypothetical protein
MTEKEGIQQTNPDKYIVERWIRSINGKLETELQSIDNLKRFLKKKLENGEITYEKYVEKIKELNEYEKQVVEHIMKAAKVYGIILAYCVEET